LGAQRTQDVDQVVGLGAEQLGQVEDQSA